MPFRYKPKDGAKRRKPFTKTDLENAIREIQGGAFIRKTAIKYGIDRTTLRRYYTSGEQKFQKLDQHGSQYKSAQVFNKAEEKELVHYLLECSKMHYGLTRKQAMALAFDYAEANSKKVPQNWKVTNSAGKDWFRGFLARNTEISLRTPEATSLSRATSFNKKNVGEFFDNLRTEREKYKFEAQNIYNCDETGCSTVQDCPKVLASKKCKQVGQVTSADRGTLVTVCFAVNAIGNVIPPFFVFPRVKYRQDFVIGGPEGSDGDAYPSGWMTKKSFLKFMEHFKKYSQASKKNRVLLILDNHESHVNEQVIKYAKDNGISLLTLPPHCSNKLQPLDVAVYSSFKSKYNAAMSNWMLSNPGRTVTIYNIPGFISTIMSESFSQSNILSGFRKSGIHPYDPNIFKEEDFMCSAVTDRDISNTENVDSISESSLRRQSQVVFHVDQEYPSTSQDVLNDSPRVLSTTLASPANNNDQIVAASDIALSPSILQADANSLTDSEVEFIDKTSPERPQVQRLSRLAVEVLNNVQSIPSTSKQNVASDVSPVSPILLKHSYILQSQHSATASTVTPEMIRPFPKAAPRKTTRRGRQPGKTKILTKTPEKGEEMETKDTSRKTKTNDKNRELKKEKIMKRKFVKDIENKTDSEYGVESRKRKGKSQRLNQKNAVRKVLQESDNETDLVGETELKEKPKKGKSQVRNGTQKKRIKKTQTKKRLKNVRKSFIESDSEEDHDIDIQYADSSNDDDWEGVPELDDRWYCFICQTEQLLDMRICVSCNRYVHEICVGLTAKDSETFICPECEG